MKFIGFTEGEMLRACDECGVPGLFFTTMPCAKGESWRGMVIGDAHITACLRVRKTECVIGPRGGQRWVHGPYARKARGIQTNAVTWDGHYRFMHKLYEINPHGTIKTAIATYKNAGEFLFFAPQTKDHAWVKG